MNIVDRLMFKIKILKCFSILENTRASVTGTPIEGFTIGKRIKGQTSLSHKMFSSQERANYISKR